MISFSRPKNRYALFGRLMFVVSAPRKAWRIWSGESPGMVRVNCLVPCHYIHRSRERLFLAREVIDEFLKGLEGE